MLKAHASDSKTLWVSQQILLISPAYQTPLVSLFNRMIDPLKLLLYSNTSNNKWILVKLTSHLWQVAYTNPQVEKLLRSLQTKSPNFPARNLVVTLMITLTTFQGTIISLSNLYRVLYVTLMITSDIVENAKYSIISYGIHFSNSLTSFG